MVFPFALAMLAQVGDAALVAAPRVATEPSAKDLKIWQRRNEEIKRLYAAGKYAEAIRLAQENVVFAEKKFPGTRQHASSLNNLAAIQYALGEYGESKRSYERALPLYERIFGKDDIALAPILNNYGETLKYTNNPAEAVRAFDRAIEIIERHGGPSDLGLLGSIYINLSSLHLDLYDYDKAEKSALRAVEIKSRVFGPSHPSTVNAQMALSWVYMRQGRLAEAKALQEKSLALAEKALGPNHTDLGAYYESYGETLLGLGEYGAARRALARAEAIQSRAFGPDSAQLLGLWFLQAQLLFETGDVAGAEALYRKAIAVSEKANGPDSDNHSAHVTDLADLLMRQGRYGEAEPLIQRNLRVSTKVYGPKSKAVGHNYLLLGQLYDRMGRAEDAEAARKKAEDILGASE